MKQIQIISIGVLTYFLLGLFNWFQNGVFIFSFPLVPILILVAFVTSLIAERPSKSLSLVQMGLFCVTQAFFSYFFLEIILPFEQQVEWVQRGIIPIGQLVSVLFLILCAHTHVMQKGKRVYNLMMGMVFTGALFVYMKYPTLPIQQGVLAAVSLVGGALGYFTKNKVFDFVGLMLLIIGVLYSMSCLNWIFY